MAFSTTPYRMLFKALEIGASVVFLFLCAKAFYSHFYNDLKRLVRKRRAGKLGPSTIQSTARFSIGDPDKSSALSPRSGGSKLRHPA
jgi:hypothetical protein